jgi:hypothetical protein
MVCCSSQMLSKQRNTYDNLSSPLPSQAGVKSTNSVVQEDQKTAKYKLKDYHMQLEKLQVFDKSLGALAKKEARLLEAVAGMGNKLRTLLETSLEGLKQEVARAESRAVRALA